MKEIIFQRWNEFKGWLVATNDLEKPKSNFCAFSLSLSYWLSQVIKYLGGPRDRLVPTLININDPVCRWSREHRPISQSSLDSKSSIEDSTNDRKAEDRLFRLG